ncbi:MAG TPA: GAF domain-containing protein, partial [Anaerolineae bacterium]|nr:GAF domain-containing protein [Anaerolineae bacterium]
ELRGLSDTGAAVRRRMAGTALYLVSHAMPMPGDANRTLYLVVAEYAYAVDPPPLLVPVTLALAVATIAVSLLHYALTTMVLKPLQTLAEGATIIGAGDLSYKIRVEQAEFDAVAQAFNAMAERLQELVVRLEQRVAARTEALERKSIQLEAISLISKEAAQMRNVNMVLDTAVVAISEKFNFYHTGIFILDDEKQWAILRSTSSEGGRRMLARGHRLGVGQVGIVGYVAGTGKPRIAFDVGGDAVWFNNPDLPETRSEMALPLKSANEVIGVLDVQSSQPQAFSDEDISTLQLMADQLAIALSNARSLEVMESAIAELREVQIDYQRRGWARMTSRTRTLAYEYDRVDTNPVPPLPVPADLLEGQVGRKMFRDGGVPVVMEAMRAGDRVVGYLGLSDTQHSWSDEELELISSVTEQVALALDNARLFEEAQRNERQQVLISSVLRVSADPDIAPEQVLVHITRVLAHSLDMAIGIFTFVIPDAPIVQPQAVLDMAGQPLPFFTHSFSLPDEHHIFFRGLSHPELGPMTPLLYLAQASGDAPPAATSDAVEALLNAYNFQRVLYVPITSGGAQAGFIAMIQRHGDLPLDPDTRELAQNLANQIGVIMSNLTLSEETRRRAEEFAQLYEAGIELLAILDVKPLLTRAADLSRRVLHAPSSVVFLRDSVTGEYMKGQSADAAELLPDIEVTTPSAHGLTEIIIQNREHVLVRDNRTYPTEGNARLVEAGLLSQIGVPLQIGEEVLGAIFVHGAAVDQFNEDDLHLLEFLATQAAAALQNALQFGRTQTALSVVERQARYQTNISQAVASLAQDGTGALEGVLELLGQAAGVDRAYYAESFEDTTGAYWDTVGAYWRLVAEWTMPDLPEALRGGTLQGLPMNKFPTLAPRLRETGFMQMMIDELPDEARELLAPLACQSLLALAIVVEDRPPGFLAFVGVREARLLQADEIGALQTAAAALSNTLVRENLFNRVQTSLSEQEALYRASAELNAADSYIGILDVLRRYTLLGQSSNNVSLNFFDRPWTDNEQPEWISVLARWSSLPADAVSDRYPLAAFPSANEFFGYTPVFFEDIANDPRLDNNLRALYLHRFRATSTIFVPLIAGGQRVGYLNAIYPQTTTFPEEEMRRLTSLAGQAAIAVQNLNQLEAIQARARREQMIREITERIQRAPDVQGVLQTGLRELGRALGTSRNVVQFRSPQLTGEEGSGDVR